MTTLDSSNIHFGEKYQRVQLFPDYMNIKPFKAALPKVNKLFSIPLFFENVKNDFAEYRDRGFYEFPSQDQLFIYEYKDEERSYTGLICATDINDYLDGTILKHEDTLIEKEEKQIKLAEERNALIKPVMLTYRTSTEIQQLLKDFKSSNEPTYTTSFKQGHHTIWSIHQPSIIKKFVKQFKTKITKAYIADGHHRSRAISRKYLESGRLKTYQYLHSIYLAEAEMKVSNWNRVITNIEKYTAIELMAMLSHSFTITPIPEPFQPTEPRTLVMYLKRKWFRLDWKRSVLKKYQHLSLEQQFDISIFNKEIVNNLLEIKNVRADCRLEHIDSRKGFDGLAKLVHKSDELSIGFIFSPLKLSDLFQVADRNQIMPPKSTFMLPRMQNGMLVAPFEE